MITNLIITTFGIYVEDTGAHCTVYIDRKYKMCIYSI